MSEDPRFMAFRRAEGSYLESLGVVAEERVVRLPGLGITGRFLEVGQGPPVLMVHGGGGLGSGWGPLIPLLEGYRLIIPDRPGFGLTEFVDYRNVDLESHAVQFLADVLDAADLESVSIVANSMGALWSLWFAAAAPERVERLALLGTPALILDTSAPGGMRLLGVPGLGRLMMSMDHPSPKQVRKLLKRMGHDPTDVCTPEMIELIVRLEQLPHYAEAWLSLLRNVLPYGRRNPKVVFDESRLRGVSQEVLYVWGSNDPFGSLDVARRARDATPGSRLEVIGVGHLPWLDEPEACASASADFFGSAR